MAKNKGTNKGKGKKKGHLDPHPGRGQDKEDVIEKKPSRSCALPLEF